MLIPGWGVRPFPGTRLDHYEAGARQPDMQSPDRWVEGPQSIKRMLGPSARGCRDRLMWN